MIWGAIFAGGRSSCIIMEWDDKAPKGGYSAESYLSVLRETLPTCFQPSMYFMQDNAGIHTAKKVTAWFQEMAIPVMEWPAYSLDLNPIEHFWAQIKQWVIKHHPELNDMGATEEAY